MVVCRLSLGRRGAGAERPRIVPALPLPPAPCPLPGPCLPFSGLRRPAGARRWEPPPASLLPPGFPRTPACRREKQRFREGKWVPVGSQQCAGGVLSQRASSSRPGVPSGSGVGEEGAAFGGFLTSWPSCHLSGSRSPLSWGSWPSSLHPAPPGHGSQSSNPWEQRLFQRPSKAPPKGRWLLGEISGMERGDTKGMGVW